MLTVNSFISGMNRDLGKTKVQQSQYYDGVNIRLVTDTGKSTGVVANVRGNEFGINLPSTGSVIKMISTEASGPITIQFVTDNFTYTGGNVHDALATFINNSTAYASFNLIAYSYKTYIKFYSLDNLNLIVANAPGRLTNTIDIVRQQSLVPIGFTNIRDEIIILSTSLSNVNPNQSLANGTPSGSGTFPNIGQIWKMTYDKSTLQTSPSTAFTLTLLYNDRLNFSRSYPVCSPGNIVGNYENEDVKKIYWGDNFNPDRNFNIADSNGFFLDVSLVDVKPDLTSSFAILQDIQQSGGHLPGGLYQYSYREKKLNGVSTRFNQLSNIVRVVSSSEDTSTQKDYIYNSTTELTATNTGKAVTMKISNIDKDYDYIDIIYTRKQNNTTSPHIALIYQNVPINKETGEYTFTHYGNENEDISVTIDDLINPIILPDKSKTKTTKDNTLFIGNISTSKLDLESAPFNYDARAVRYMSSAYLNQTYPIGATPGLLDDINPSQKPVGQNQYIYQLDGTTLGGQGANIKYEFVTYTTDLDTTGLKVGPPYKVLPKTDVTYNFGITGQDYPSGRFYQDHSSPYVETILRGFQRDETYRFGIQFFDKKSNPCWVMWIGDIRFPHRYMPDLTSATPSLGERTEQFPITQLVGDTYKALNLGIKFTVDVSSIANFVSGYKIVRVKREEQDKSIVATGVIQPTYTEAGHHFLQNWNNYNETVVGTYESNLCSIVTPESFFQTFGGLRGRTGDLVEIIGKTKSELANTQHSWTNPAGVPTEDITRGFIHKLYLNYGPTIISPSTSTTAVGRSMYLGESSTHVPSYYNFPNNFTYATRTVTNVCKPSRYLTTHAVEGAPVDVFVVANSASAIDGYSTINSGTTTGRLVDYMNATNDNMLTGTSTERYIAQFKRKVDNGGYLPNQYGGKDIGSKANNEYMSCNHYQPVSSTDTILTSDVFGGDVYINAWDNVLQKKGWTVGSAGTPAGGTTDPELKLSVGIFLAVESCTNTPLRSKSVGGVGLDNTFPTLESSYFRNDAVVPSLDLNESDAYNITMSSENDTFIYLTKPYPFTEQTVFDHRIMASNVKIDGEQTDSWLQFAVGAYKDVDSIYGPINNISTLNNVFYFWQDRAFGQLPVNRRQTLPGVDSILIGSGPQMDKQEYISTKIGSKHQWSILPTDKAFYWYDVISNKQIRYSSSGLQHLSDDCGMHSLLETKLSKDSTNLIVNNDNPILFKGISTVFDYKYNEAIFSFLNNNTTDFTLSFSELTNSYTTRYSFTEPIYITDRYIFLSQKPSSVSRLYVHDYGEYGKFYDAYTDSSITFLTNEHPDITKVFNTQELQTEVLINNVDTSTSALGYVQETFNKVTHSTDYQTTGTITLVPGTTIKRKFRTWRLDIARDTNVSQYSPTLYPRIRDKYMYTELAFTNNNNKKIVLSDVKTGFTVAPY